MNVVRVGPVPPATLLAMLKVSAPPTLGKPADSADTTTSSGAPFGGPAAMRSSGAANAAGVVAATAAGMGGASGGYLVAGGCDVGCPIVAVVPVALAGEVLTACPAAITVSATSSVTAPQPPSNPQPASGSGALARTLTMRRQSRASSFIGGAGPPLSSHASATSGTTAQPSAGGVLSSAAGGSDTGSSSAGQLQPVPYRVAMAANFAKDLIAMQDVGIIPFSNFRKHATANNNNTVSKGSERSRTAPPSTTGSNRSAPAAVSYSSINAGGVGGATTSGLTGSNNSGTAGAAREKGRGDVYTIRANVLLDTQPPVLPAAHHASLVSLVSNYVASTSASKTISSAVAPTTPRSAAAGSADNNTTAAPAGVGGALPPVVFVSASAAGSHANELQALKPLLEGITSDVLRRRNVLLFNRGTQLSGKSAFFLRLIDFLTQALAPALDRALLAYQDQKSRDAETAAASATEAAAAQLAKAPPPVNAATANGNKSAPASFRRSPSAKRCDSPRGAGRRGRPSDSISLLAQGSPTRSRFILFSADHVGPRPPSALGRRDASPGVSQLTPRGNGIPVLNEKHADGAGGSSGDEAPFDQTARSHHHHSVAWLGEGFGDTAALENTLGGTSSSASWTTSKIESGSSSASSPRTTTGPKTAAPGGGPSPRGGPTRASMGRRSSVKLRQSLQEFIHTAHVLDDATKAVGDGAVWRHCMQFSAFHASHVVLPPIATLDTLIKMFRVDFWYKLEHSIDKAAPPQTILHIAEGNRSEVGFALHIGMNFNGAEIDGPNMRIFIRDSNNRALEAAIPLDSGLCHYEKFHHAMITVRSLEESVVTFQFDGKNYDRVHFVQVERPTAFPPTMGRQAVHVGGLKDASLPGSQVVNGFDGVLRELRIWRPRDEAVDSLPSAKDAALRQEALLTWRMADGDITKVPPRLLAPLLRTQSSLGGQERDGTAAVQPSAKGGGKSGGGSTDGKRGPGGSHDANSGGSGGGGGGDGESAAPQQQDGSTTASGKAFQGSDTKWEPLSCWALSPCNPKDIHSLVDKLEKGGLATMYGGGSSGGAPEGVLAPVNHGSNNSSQQQAAPQVQVVGVTLVDLPAPLACPYFDGWRTCLSVPCLTSVGEYLHAFSFDVRFNTTVTNRTMCLFGVQDSQRRKAELMIVLNAEPVFNMGGSRGSSGGTQPPSNGQDGSSGASKGASSNAPPPPPNFQQRLRHAPYSATVMLTDSAGRTMAGLIRFNERFHVCDGTWHTITWKVIDSESNKMEIRIDGAAVDSIVTIREGPRSFLNFSNWLCVGGCNVRGWRVQYPFQGLIRMMRFTVRGDVACDLQLNQGCGASVSPDLSGHGFHGIYMDATVMSERRHGLVWLPQFDEKYTNGNGADGTNGGDEGGSGGQSAADSVRLYKRNDVRVALLCFGAVLHPTTHKPHEMVFDLMHSQADYRRRLVTSFAAPSPSSTSSSGRPPTSGGTASSSASPSAGGSAGGADGRGGGTPVGPTAEQQGLLARQDEVAAIASAVFVHGRHDKHRKNARAPDGSAQPGGTEDSSDASPLSHSSGSPAGSPSSDLDSSFDLPSAEIVLPSVSNDPAAIALLECNPSSIEDGITRRRHKEWLWTHVPDAAFISIDKAVDVHEIMYPAAAAVQAKLRKLYQFLTMPPQAAANAAAAGVNNNPAVAAAAMAEDNYRFAGHLVFMLMVGDARVVLVDLHGPHIPQYSTYNSGAMKWTVPLSSFGAEAKRSAFVDSMVFAAERAVLKLTAIPDLALKAKQLVAPAQVEHHLETAHALPTTLASTLYSSVADMETGARIYVVSSLWRTVSEDDAAAVATFHNSFRSSAIPVAIVHIQRTVRGTLARMKYRRLRHRRETQAQRLAILAAVRASQPAAYRPKAVLKALVIACLNPFAPSPVNDYHAANRSGVTHGEGEAVGDVPPPLSALSRSGDDHTESNSSHDGRGAASMAVKSGGSSGRIAESGGTNSVALQVPLWTQAILGLSSNPSNTAAGSVPGLTSSMQSMSLAASSVGGTFRCLPPMSMTSSVQPVIQALEAQGYAVTTLVDPSTAECRAALEAVAADTASSHFVYVAGYGTTSYAYPRTLEIDLLTLGSMEYHARADLEEQLVKTAQDVRSQIKAQIVAAATAAAAASAKSSGRGARSGSSRPATAAPASARKPAPPPEPPAPQGTARPGTAGKSGKKGGKAAAAIAAGPTPVQIKHIQEQKDLISAEVDARMTTILRPCEREYDVIVAAFSDANRRIAAFEATYVHFDTPHVLSSLSELNGQLGMNAALLPSSAAASGGGAASSAMATTTTTVGGPSGTTTTSASAAPQAASRLTTAVGGTTSRHGKSRGITMSPTFSAFDDASSGGGGGAAAPVLMPLILPSVNRQSAAFAQIATPFVSFYPGGGGAARGRTAAAASPITTTTTASDASSSPPRSSTLRRHPERLISLDDIVKWVMGAGDDGSRPTAAGSQIVLAVDLQSPTSFIAKEGTNNSGGGGGFGLLLASNGKGRPWFYRPGQRWLLSWSLVKALRGATPALRSANMVAILTGGVPDAPAESRDYVTLLEYVAKKLDPICPCQGLLANRPIADVLDVEGPYIADVLPIHGELSTAASRALASRANEGRKALGTMYVASGVLDRSAAELAGDIKAVLPPMVVVNDVHVVPVVFFALAASPTRHAGSSFGDAAAAFGSMVTSSSLRRPPASLSTNPDARTPLGVDADAVAGQVRRFCDPGVGAHVTVTPAGIFVECVGLTAADRGRVAHSVSVVAARGATSQIAFTVASAVDSSFIPTSSSGPTASPPTATPAGTVPSPAVTNGSSSSFAGEFAVTATEVFYAVKIATNAREWKRLTKRVLFENGQLGSASLAARVVHLTAEAV